MSLADQNVFDSTILIIIIMNYLSFSKRCRWSGSWPGPQETVRPYRLAVTIAAAFPVCPDDMFGLMVVTQQGRVCVCVCVCVFACVFACVNVCVGASFTQFDNLLICVACCLTSLILVQSFFPFLLFSFFPLPPVLALGDRASQCLR